MMMISIDLCEVYSLAETIDHHQRTNNMKYSGTRTRGGVFNLGASQLAI